MLFEDYEEENAEDMSQDQLLQYAMSSYLQDVDLDLEDPFAIYKFSTLR